MIERIEQAGRAERPEDADGIGIWPENWDIVKAFLAIITQWRVIALPGALHYVGLDYAGAAAGLAEAGIAGSPPLWAGVRLMEAEYRNVMNSRR